MRGGKGYQLPCNNGFPLGTMRECFVKDEEGKLERGDYLFLYTDGITEARNQNGEFYGMDRLKNFFDTVDQSNVLSFHRDLVQDIAKFVDGAPQSDDMTFIYFQYIGLDAVKNEVTLPADEEGLTAALSYTGEQLEKNGISHLFPKIKVVVDEIFSNIVKYAYSGNPGGVYLRFIYIKELQRLILIFADNGVAFNPLEREIKPLEDGVNSKEGGLGIYIVKQLAEKVSYYRFNGNNVLLIEIDASKTKADK